MKNRIEELAQWLDLCADTFTRNYSDNEVGIMLAKMRDAAEALRSQSLQPPVWSGVAPTCEGWYWHIQKIIEHLPPNIEIRHVRKDARSGELCCRGAGAVRHMKGEWSGPIPKPA